MKNETHQAIVDALDLLASGRASKSDGKVTGVNVAREASIGKATLYRFFNEHPDLRDSYVAMRKNKVQVADGAPETIQQAYRLLKADVKQLRSELSGVKRNAEQTDKLKSHQILLLWSDNERLKNELKRLNERSANNGNMMKVTFRKE